MIISGFWRQVGAPLLLSTLLLALWGGASLGPLTVLAGVLIVGGAVLGNLSGRRA